MVKREQGENGNSTDHRAVEDVDARVDVVPDPLLRLLHETVDQPLRSTNTPEDTVSSARTTPYFEGSSVVVTFS